MKIPPLTKEQLLDTVYNFHMEEITKRVLEELVIENWASGIEDGETDEIYTKAIETVAEQHGIDLYELKRELLGIE